MLLGEGAVSSNRKSEKEVYGEQLEYCACSYSWYYRRRCLQVTILKQGDLRIHQQLFTLDIVVRLDLVI